MLCPSMVNTPGSARKNQLVQNVLWFSMAHKKGRNKREKNISKMLAYILFFLNYVLYINVLAAQVYPPCTYA